MRAKRDIFRICDVSALVLERQILLLKNEMSKRDVLKSHFDRLEGLALVLDGSDIFDRKQRSTFLDATFDERLRLNHELAKAEVRVLDQLDHARLAFVRQDILRRQFC